MRTEVRAPVGSGCAGLTDGPTDGLCSPLQQVPGYSCMSSVWAEARGIAAQTAKQSKESIERVGLKLVSAGMR